MALDWDSPFDFKDMTSLVVSCQVSQAFQFGLFEVALITKF